MMVDNEVLKFISVFSSKKEKSSACTRLLADQQLWILVMTESGVKRRHEWVEKKYLQLRKQVYQKNRHILSRHG